MPVPRGICLSQDGRTTVGELNTEGGGGAGLDKGGMGRERSAGEELIVAEGGVGGGPANDFKRGRPAPFPLHFDLKLLADVGFVG